MECYICTYDFGDATAFFCHFDEEDAPHVGDWLPIVVAENGIVRLDISGLADEPDDIPIVLDGPGEG